MRRKGGATEVLEHADVSELKSELEGGPIVLSHGLVPTGPRYKLPAVRVTSLLLAPPLPRARVYSI